MIATVIDAHRLLVVAATSLAAGIGVPTLFAFGVLGATRTADLRRRGAGAALAYAALTAVCLAGCAGAVVLGIIVLTRK